MSRLTEEEIARVQNDLEGLDEEIRRLEYEATFEQQSRFSGDPRRISQNYTQMLASPMPYPEYGGGGGGVYAYAPQSGYAGYAPAPFISPLAGPYVLQPSQYAQVPAWPSYGGQNGAYGGYYPQMMVASPQMMFQPSPAYMPQPQLYAQQQTSEPPSRQTSQDLPTRERSGTQSLEEVQALAAKKNVGAERPDLGTALRSSVVFTLTMIGEAAFFMIRDWLDTTKTRPRKSMAQNSELEESMALAALEQLEKTGKEGVGKLTEKQKMKQVKSMRQLMRATSVSGVVSGLRNSGRDEEAESLALRLVAVRKQMYGLEHIATAQALNQLGSVQVLQQEYEDAIGSYREALEVLRAAFAHKPASSALHEAHLLHNLAAATIMLADCEKSASKEEFERLKQEALQLGAQCVEVSEKKLGPTHRKTLQYKRVWVPGFAETFKAEHQTPAEPETVVHPVDLVLQAAVSIKE